jgi:hypothetical protein
MTVNPILLTKAKWASLVERNTPNGTRSKHADVALALIDVLEYGTEEGLLGESDELPLEIDEILTNVYHYLEASQEEL